MHEDIKSRLNSGNALLPLGSQSSVLPLLSGNVKVKIYKTIILPVVFMAEKLYL
jgi:hypothetical protein